MVNRGPVWSRHGVEEQGLGEAATVYWNLPPARLYEEAVKRGEAAISADGALICHTGEFTGRSPNDKFVVEEPGSSGEVWWGKVNKPISPAHFDALLAKARKHLAGRDIFGIGFFTADRVARRLGFAEDGEPRLSAAIRHVLDASREAGHCYLRAEQVQGQVLALLSPPDPESVAARIDGVVARLLQDGGIRVRQLPLGPSPDSPPSGAPTTRGWCRAVMPWAVSCCMTWLMAPRRSSRPMTSWMSGAGRPSRTAKTNGTDGSWTACAMVGETSMSTRPARKRPSYSSATVARSRAICSLSGRRLGE